MGKDSQAISALLLCSLLLPIIGGLIQWTPSSYGLPLPYASNGNDHEDRDGVSQRPLNYNLSLSPSNVALVQGSTTVVGITVASSSTSVGRVTLTARGLPGGVSVFFNPAFGSPNPSFSSLMLITTNSSATEGTFNINVTATSATRLVRIASLVLTVVPASSLVTVVSASAPTVASLGEIVRVNATVANYGSSTENIRLDLLVNGTSVDHATAGLTAFSLIKTALAWNTSHAGVSGGTYNLAIQILFPSNQPPESSLFPVGKLLLEALRQTSTLTSGVSRVAVMAIAIAEAGAVLLAFLLLRRRRIMAYRRGIQTRLH